MLLLLLTGSADICLSEFGHCNFISSRQACIFYDKVGGHMANVVKQCDMDVLISRPLRIMSLSTTASMAL